MVIEYLVSPSLFEVIKIPFSQYEDFDNFPSQLYFMMILDACNTSAEIEIEGEEKDFTDLSPNFFSVKTYMILLPLI